MTHNRKKCFAIAGNSCKALKVKACTECNFYKSEEDYELEKERALKRLKSLDKATRLSIAEKYKIQEII